MDIEHQLIWMLREFMTEFPNATVPIHLCNFWLCCISIKFYEKHFFCICRERKFRDPCAGSQRLALCFCSWFGWILFFRFRIPRRWIFMLHTHFSSKGFSIFATLIRLTVSIGEGSAPLVLLMIYCIATFCKRIAFSWPMYIWDSSNFLVLPMKLHWLHLNPCGCCSFSCFCRRIRHLKLVLHAVQSIGFAFMW